MKNLAVETTTMADVFEQVVAKLNHVPGQHVVCYLPGNAGRIASVEEWVFDNGKRLTGVHLFQTLALGPAEGWARAVEGGAIPVTPFIGTGMRQLVNDGLAKNIRCNLSQVPRLFGGYWRPDVAFAHTSPPDEYGRVTLGLNAGLDYTAVRSAKFKVAIVNEMMPRWHIGMYYDPATNQHFETGCAMQLSEFDLVVHVSEPLLEHPMVPKVDQQENAAAVAEHIYSLLAEEADRDGNLPHTLQLGIGMIPNAVATALADSKVSVQGIWSEMFSDGVLQLYQQGRIRNTKGTYLRDHIVVGFVLGTKELYWTMHDNPDFAVLPQEYVNDPAMIKHNPYMVSINSTISASVTGEIAAATMGKRYHSDVGGQHDFATGASWSKGGKAFIACLSTARLKDGSVVSKIVAKHPEGTHHTISADLPVLVVTEHGLADLRYVDDRMRVERMLKISHPDMVRVIAKEARALPAIQGVDSIAPRLVSLRSGTQVMLRPVTGEEDIVAISAYLKEQSQEDLQTRYMGMVKAEALTNPARMQEWYVKTLDHTGHAAFVVEDLEGTILGVSQAWLEDSGKYEISFSRRSALKGQGIASHLMFMLREWGVAREIPEFTAITYRTRNPRMRSCFDNSGWKCSDVPGEPDCVQYKVVPRDIITYPLAAVE